MSIFKYKNKGTGGIEDLFDERDFTTAEVFTSKPQPDWKEKNKEDFRSFPIFDQDGSNSCVGQAVAKVLGIENYLEEDKFVHFSARDIYSRGYVEPDGGMYYREGMKIGHEHGATVEQLMPSQNMGEQEMRDKEATILTNRVATIARGGAYISVNVDFDEIAGIIEQTGKGVAIGTRFDSGGFSEPEVELKRDGEYGHAVVAVDYTMWKGVKALVIENSWGCFDKDTEILTNEGWKFFENLRENEIVATLNPENHNLEYQKISERQVYEYNDYLWNYKGRDIDLLVTPNHKLYYKPVTNNTDWKLQQADQIDIKNFKMKKDANWGGEERNKHKVGDKEIPMDLWLEFLGYFISEGHTNLNEFWRKERRRKKKYKVKGEQPRNKENGRFIQSSKERKIEKEYLTKEKPFEQFCYNIGISQKDRNYKIQKCLDKMPWEFTRNNHSWTTNNKDLFSELEELGKSHEKFIPNYVKELSPRQLEIFLDALMLGDGSGEPLKKWTYYTSSKQLADDVQEILLKIGYAGDISYTNRIGRKNSNGITRHIEYRVNIKTTELEQTKKNGFVPEKMPYQGKIYCVTVPNHIVYVRRNGKAVWSGNSDWGWNGQGVVTEDQKYGIVAAWYFEDLSNERKDRPEKPDYEFNEDLEYGDQNNDVARLQEVLKYTGHFSTNIPCTGYFGTITQKAVRQFQCESGIICEGDAQSTGWGRVGPKTRNKLNSLK